MTNPSSHHQPTGGSLDQDADQVDVIFRKVPFIRPHKGPAGPDRDRGQITVAVVILAVGALTVVGLVYFGGLKLRAGREAGNIAEEAARAGAGQLGAGTYTGGTATLDPAAAVARARAYLASASQANGGVSGTVTLVSGTRVRVTVTVTRPAAMLDLIGASSIGVTRSATADLTVGVRTGH